MKRLQEEKHQGYMVAALALSLSLLLWQFLCWPTFLFCHVAAWQEFHHLQVKLFVKDSLHPQQWLILQQQEESQCFSKLLCMPLPQIQLNNFAGSRLVGKRCFALKQGNSDPGWPCLRTTCLHVQPTVGFVEW